jgi:glycosyltransferase involved in cell wall biosynthesis
VVGQLKKEKNLDDLIWLSRQLKERGMEGRIRIDVYGAGPMFEDLRAEERASSILALQGYVSDAATIFSGKHVHLSLSRVEGFGRVITEAMSFGVPTVAYMSGAFPEIITSGVDGLLCRTKDELLDKIIEIAECGLQLDSMSVAARKTFAQRFTVERFVDSTLKVIGGHLPSASEIIR